MGSITQALRTAQSGLLVNQRVMDTIAQNVTNVNTEGYSRKIVRLENRTLDGTGSGVDISDIVRAVDEGLLRSVRIESSDLNALAVQEDYFSRLQDLFGAPGDNTSISHDIDELARAAESLALTPERALEKSEFIQQAQNVTLAFESLSDSIQELRRQADQDLDSIAKQMSTLVSEIDQLNDDIIKNGSVNRDTTDLRDQRDERLTELSELIDISYFFRDDGDVVVFTQNGATLVDTVPPTISHTGAAAVSATTTHDSGEFNGFFIGDSAVEANDQTDFFRGGQVKGLVEMRDEILPNLQSQLDQLAANMRDQLNQIHNRGVSFPGAQDYNGTRNFIEPTNQTIQLDPTNSVDDVTILLMNTSGEQDAKTTLNTIMTDAGFSSRGSGDDWHIDDVANTLQSWLRANSSSSASVTVSGGGGLNIALNNSSLGLSFRDETATADGSDQADAEIGFDADGDGNVDETISGFANFFGLNDLFVDNLADNIYDSEVQNTSFTSSAGTLTFRDSNGAIGTLAVSLGDSLQDIADAINLDTTLSEDITASVITDGSGQRLRIAHNDGSSFTVTDGAGEAVISTIGLAVSDVRTSSLLSVRSDIQNTPGFLSTGAPRWDSARGSGGEYFMGVGDESVIGAMAEAMAGQQSFSLTGGLASNNVSFSQRAAEIVATNASLASINQSNIDSQESLTQSLEFKQRSESGVNLDEELANLIIFEQAFSAAARVITTINEMFDALERIT